MPRVKQVVKQTRITKTAAATAVGAAGLGLSLAGSGPASATLVANTPQSDDISPNQRWLLNDEEMSDVSLATFHLFDKENLDLGGQQVAVIVRGCGGCRGCRACRGCGWRGCAGCGGCGGCGCCARWGRCRWC
jgi:hypothetical protein